MAAPRRKNVSPKTGPRDELEQLANRVAALERQLEAPPASAPRAAAGSGSSADNPFQAEVEQRFKALPAEARQRPIGKIRGITYFRYDSGVGRGALTTDLDELLALPETAAAHSLAGLAHPVRIKLYRALLERSQHGLDSAGLMTAAGLNTTGQLYHHLREMEEVGLVMRRGRNLWAAHNLFCFAFAMVAAQGLMRSRGEGAVEEAAEAAAGRAAKRTPKARASAAAA